MTHASSALPALEDLQAKARNFRFTNPKHYVELETCCRQNTLDQSVHSCAQTCVSPPVVGPETDFQYAPRHPAVGVQVFRDCTDFRPKRFYSSLFRYRPFRRQKSSPGNQRERSQDSSAIDTCSAVTFVFICFISLLCFFISLHDFIVDHNHNNATQEKFWYKNASFYEIFPASFKDTDSDGYGDFQGIIQKLDYIRDLGISAIRLNSIYSALDYPLEFEHIIDLRSADPHLGHLDDFKDLVRECHCRGLRVVLDLNPTITSDQYTWAFHWQRGIPGYEHFYVSANRSKDPPEMENSEGPPSEDWELTQRTFGAHYVLNWSYEVVQVEFRHTLHFWTMLGVDGFYMKHLEKLHVANNREIPKILEQWRKVLDRPLSQRLMTDSTKRVLIVSSKFAQDMKTKLEKDAWKDMLKHVDLVDFPLLVGDAQEMAEQISSLELISKTEYGSSVPMWHLGSSDTFRFASRVDSTYQMAAFYLLMSLSGSSSIFYGDEVGLKDSYDVFSERIYRGGQLTPMQWKADNASGGFTDSMTNPWLPLTPEHFSINVESQTQRLSEIRKLLRLRRHMDKMTSLKVISPNIIVVERSGTCEGTSKKCLFTFEVNLGNNTVSIRDMFPIKEPYQIEMTTTESDRDGLEMEPGSAYLFRSKLFVTAFC